jgi:hypothetical protein
VKTIDINPKNKEHFIKLKEFCYEIIGLCGKIKVNPVLYGSAAIFAYTQDEKSEVNDFDFLIQEKEFKKIISELEKNGVRYEYSPEWHTLQVFKGKLKIEFDSRDFWQKDLPNDFEMVDFGDLKLKAVSLNTLKKIYKKASEVSKDNSHGNRKKYEILKRMG